MGAVMKEVGVLEAKTNLSALLAEVETTGESVAITRHGKRIARLTPEGRLFGGHEAGKKRMSKDELQAFIRETFARQDAEALQNPKLLEPYDLRADRDSIE
jgi:prevent-host-death family protein